MDSRLAKLEATLPSLATKIDIADTKTEIAKIGGTISDAKYDVLKYFGTILLALLSIAVGILLYAINRISPSATTAPAAQPPIVIYPQQQQSPSASSPQAAGTTKR